MSNNGYNGWSNWSTWNVMLWLNNDEMYYRGIVLQAPREIYEERFIRDTVLRIFEENGEFGDIDTEEEMCDVDWAEVTAAILRDAGVDDDDEDDDDE